MDTDVYVFCKACNKITSGIGSGDLRDTIECKCCGKKFITANAIGNFKPFENGDELRLYWPE